ncbi:MAG: response regulator [Nitrospirae bacterium]|nr:MAG: response regulator [Nitrospirota bacterium]
MLLNLNSTKESVPLTDSLRYRKVLLIEDSPADRMLVRQFLSEPSRECFSLHFAGLLSEGLYEIKKEIPDIVLLDLNLPDSSGMKTLKTFLKEAPDVPVIIMTSLDDELLGLDTIKTGAQDYLFKWNTSPETLVRSINYAVERHTLKQFCQNYAVHLHESEQKLFNIINNSPDSILVVDDDGLIKFANPMAVRLFGLRTLTGTSLYDFLPGFGFVCPLDNKSSDVREVEFVNNEGRLTTAEVSSVEMEWAGLNVHLVFFHDITRRKQIEKELSLTNKRLKEMDGMKSDLAHFIVHDMKGPLGAVMANIELLGLKRCGNEDSEYLNLALEDIYKLQRMVNNILDVLASEGSSMSVRKKPTDVGALIAGESRSFITMASLRGIEVRLDGGPLSFPLDAELIARTISNLLMNAFENTPDGGRVIVSYGLDSSGTELSVSVSDSGNGVPDAIKERIFDKFFSTCCGASSPGRGLGLAFCFMAVNGHGGIIRVEDAPGGGAKFVFTLPCSSQEDTI